MEQNGFDSSAFAILFLWARHAGATVLHMQLLTHGVTFDVDF